MQLRCNPLLADLIEDGRLPSSWDGDEKKKGALFVA